jgi:hypothetical protein
MLPVSVVLGTQEKDYKEEQKTKSGVSGKWVRAKPDADSPSCG